MTSKRGFTLVELLVVIAIIAVLLAILLPSLTYVKSTAQRIQCSSKLKSIGQSLSFYGDKYDGAIPRPEHATTDSGQSNKADRNAHYYIYKRSLVADTDPCAANYIWMNMGCFFGASLLESGRMFYCPATEGWLDEYKTYSTVGPWGTLPQSIPQNSGNQWLRAWRGYVWAPQAKTVVTQADITASRYSDCGPTDPCWPNYQVGYPKYAMKAVDLEQDKAISTDITFHSVKGSGWNANAVFPDTHVAFQKQPKNTAGQGTYFTGSQFPTDVFNTSTNLFMNPVDEAANRRTTLAEYMFSLQP